MPAPRSPHRVVIAAYPGVQALDLTGPFEVFAGCDRLLDHLGARTGYEVTVVAEHPGPVRTESGLGVVADAALPHRGPIGTLVIPGGHGVRRMSPDDAYLTWLGRAVARADRVASVCTGAFALAAVGGLDGIRATTHWRHAAELARRHPAVQVDADAIHLRQGRVWTSAGVTAGLDLALALIEADHDADVAQTVARELVMFLRRPGGQSQFAGPVWEEPARVPSIRAAQDLIHADPAADLRVPVLAARVGMSERHFSREFTRALGASPGDYVERVRVDAARRLLESEPVLVSVAASRSGFGTAETMRRAFVRRLGIPPDDYRRRFATT
ncbi:MAG: GlxA family transcriptional regulator [Dermatophilaceae bacterium]